LSHSDTGPSDSPNFPFAVGIIQTIGPCVASGYSATNALTSASALVKGLNRGFPLCASKQVSLSSLLLEQFLNKTFSDTKAGGYFSRLTTFEPSALSLFLSGGRGSWISLPLPISCFPRHLSYLITSENAVTHKNNQ
jgi:hypothetical protein